MLDRPLHCDRRLLNMLLATMLVAPLSLAAQERDKAVDKPASKAGQTETRARQDARPADNPAAVFDRLDRNSDGVLVADEIPEAQAKAFGRLIRIGDRNKDGRLTRQEFLSSLEPDRDRPAPSDRRRTGQRRSVDPAQSFDRFDKNKDGRLTLDEFPEGVRERIAALLKQSGKDSMNREGFAKLYQSRPVGNQGKKTRKRPESPRVPQPANDRARREQFFDRLDRNKDGQLTEQEFPESSRGLFTFLARRLEKKPGDSISRKEFIASLPSQRPRPDQPGPGRPRPGQPGERPRPDAPREAGRGPAIFRVLDLNRDGRISREELAKAAAQFEQLDTNRDGQLDPREFFGTRGSAERPPSRPAARSGTRPGQRPEARPGVRPQQPRRPETTRENDRPRTTRGPAADSSGGRLFERLDRDGSGRIEASEVPALLRDRLKRLDSNGDGRISPEEFSRGLKEGNQRLRERPPLPRRQPRDE